MGGESGKIEARLVLQSFGRAGSKYADEDIVDKVLHRLAAAAMRKRHRRHMDLAESTFRWPWHDVHVAAAIVSSRCGLTPPY